MTKVTYDKLLKQKLLHQHQTEDIAGYGDFDMIQFNTLEDYSTALAEGKVRWNYHDQTIEYGTKDGRKVQVNQELGLPMRNSTGAKLLNGKCVRINGYNESYYTIEYSDNRTKERAHVDFMLSADVEDGEMTVPTKIGICRGIDTSTCVENDTVYLGEDGNWTCTKPTSPRYTRPIGHIGKVDINGEIYVSITNQEQGDIEEQLRAANIPHGIPVDQKPNITLQYNPVNRELICSGSFYYFINTEKIIANAITETVVHDNTSGTYFYILSKDLLGNPLLIVKNTFFTLGTDIPLAFVIYNNAGASTFWSGVNGKLFCERHGCEMDKATHFELHNNLGCYAKEGFGLAGYVQASGVGSLENNTFSIDSGKIYDEDNHTLIPTLPDNNGVGANYNVWYKSGNDWLWYESNLPYLLETEMKYNPITGGSGALADLTGNSFMNMWIVGMPELDKSTGLATNDGFGFIVGQKVYASLDLAVGESFFDVDLSGFSSAEVAPLWQITFRRAASYTASVGSVRIESVRKIVGTRFVSGTQATSPSIHNNLAGRDAANSHPISAITGLQPTLDGKVDGPDSSVENSIPVFDGVTGKLLKVSSVVVNGDNMKPQLVSFKMPCELTGTNAMDFNLNQNWIVYLSGATTTITMTPITASPVFTCNIEVVQDATGGRDLVLVDVDGKAIVNTQEFDFTSGGANERCFITIKYWVTGYRYLVDKYI